MNSFRSLVAMLTVLLLAGCGRAPPPALSITCPAGDLPAATVCGFYKTYLAARAPGLPERSEQEKLAPFLSAGLLKAMDDARRYQQAFRLQNPRAKPPLADGWLFTSLFENPTGFEMLQTDDQADGSARVHVKFHYTENAEWEDVVVVIREANRWVIDDVLLSGAGPFNPGGRVRERLAYRGQA